MASGSAAAPRKVVTSAWLSIESVPDPEGLILPNRQAARSLGVPYRSLEGLARRTLQSHGLRVAGKIEAHRALGRAAARSGTGHDPAGLARAAEATLRELLRAGVDLDALQRDPNPRVRRLALIAANYRDLLASAGLIDPAELLWRASELVSERTIVQLRGFPRLPAPERAFLDAVAAPGSVVHLPLPNEGDAGLFAENREALRDFEERGWQTEQGMSPRATLGPGLATAFLGGTREETSASVVCYGYPDLEAEARGTLSQVKRLLLAGVTPDQVAVVARNEESYGPVLLSVAQEYQVPLRVLYQVPLAQTRFGAWLGQLVEALGDDLPFEATARLLAHPLVDALDAAAWSRARSGHTSGWEAWSGLLPLLGEPWPQSAPREQYTQRLGALVERLGARSKARAWARETQACTVFFEAVRALPNPSAQVTLEAFLAEIDELARLLTVTAHPGRGGVELHTPLSLFGATVDHLFVVGMGAGVLPSPVRPDPLLDPLEREELRARGFPVEDVAREAAREELSFWALLQSPTSSLTLSFPRLLGRSEALPSPYISRLGLEPRDPPLAAICSSQELRRAQLPGDERFDGVLEAARHAYGVEARRESEAPFDGHDGVVGVPYLPPAGGVAVTGLVSLANCPFKFFGERVLRLGEPDEAAENLEPSLRGKLFHEVLHRVMEPLAAGGDEAGEGAEAGGAPASAGGGPTDAGSSPADAGSAPANDPRAAALERLDDAFRAAEEELALADLPTWSLEREQHLETLRRAIASEGFIGAGARVRELESPFQGRWHGIPVRGRVDRIDELPHGLELLDYKSGSSVSNLAKDRTGRPKVDLQLSIYREAAAAVLAPGEPVAGSRYFSVTRAEDLRVATPPEEELDRIADEAKAAWRSGSYPIDPDIQGEACRYCPLDPLCRKGPRLERKRQQL